MHRLAWRTPLFALLLVAGSCASLAPKIETPQISLVGIQVLSTDMFAQQFRARLKVENPNDIEVPVKGIDYEVFLMGDRFAEGASDHSFVLPARGEAEFDMTVTTNFVSGFGRLVSRMGGNKLEDVEYEIAGHLLVDKGWVHKIPFDHKGTVNFTKSLGKLKSEK